jgi:hypothetical protein
MGNVAGAEGAFDLVVVGDGDYIEAHLMGGLLEGSLDGTGTIPTVSGVNV